MKIHVRRRHIEKGKWGDCELCPVALAFKETTGIRPEVTYRVLFTCDGEFPLPRSAQLFISNFDLGKPVKPFAFVLK